MIKISSRTKQAPSSLISPALTQMSLTLEVWSAACHEELDGLNLGQVTVLVLLLCVAVSPVVQTELHCYITGLNIPDEHRGITYIAHECPLP